MPNIVKDWRYPDLALIGGLTLVHIESHDRDCAAFFGARMIVQAVNGPLLYVLADQGEVSCFQVQMTQTLHSG